MDSAVAGHTDPVFSLTVQCNQDFSNLKLDFVLLKKLLIMTVTVVSRLVYHKMTALIV